MPGLLSAFIELAPSTHFVSFARSILYRGAGFAIVWPEFLVFFALALWRFRKGASQASCSAATGVTTATCGFVASRTW